MARAVRFDLIADPSRYVRGMRQAERSSRRFTDHTSRAGSAVKAAFATFSAAAVVVEMRKWVDAARDANRVAAQTDAVIKSTGGAAGLSARGFSDLAKQISRTAAVDDDLVQGGENILATFTKIKAGGPDRIFERTEAAAVDMAAALNQGQVTAEGLQSANLVLGKALQDPIAGLTRLQRVGVSFDQTQKDQIKRFVEAGQVAKAQGVILAEVNREFGGSAAAAVTPAKRLAVTWGNMQEVLGNLLIPAIDRGATILSGALEVVDGNRKAFGLLFGVLGAGTAVVLTLIAAEKAHRAVVDASRVASEAWAAIQKGLNVILRRTAIEAVTTAAAEQGLAASTRDASAAASASRANWIALGGAIGIGTAAMWAANEANKHTTQTQQTWIDAVLTTLGPLGALAGRTIGHEKAAKGAAAATQQNAAALGTLNPLQQQAAEKTAATAAKTSELAGKLQTLKSQYDQQTSSIRQTIQGYDGLASKSGVTARQVVKDLLNQVANFRTYSFDVRRLIKAGVDPSAIRELSEKGPQYVHALAEGSNRELEQYKSYWRDRQREVRGRFADSLELQYQDVVKKIRRMQRQIDSLKGKSISITAKPAFQFSKSFTRVDWLSARLAAGRMAAGGRITRGTGPTADDVPIWVSRKETVVSARDSEDPWFQTWARAQGIPGFQRGGLVGERIAQTGAAHTGVANLMGAFTKRTLDRALAKLLAGSPAIRAFIRSTDPLPYIWGGAGPRGYDCSGLVSAVLGKMTGKGGGHGQRYFTTASIRPGILGIRSGLGGMLQIGVTPGRGHMAGRYAGLGFEAESTRTGIKVGGAASRPEGFARHYHLARGGRIGGGFHRGGPVVRAEDGSLVPYTFFAHRGRGSHNAHARAHAYDLARWISGQPDRRRFPFATRWGIPPPPPGLIWAEDYSLLREHAGRRRGTRAAYRGLPQLLTARRRFRAHYGTGYATGGRLDREAFARLAALGGLDIGGDPGRLRINGKVFDAGGFLPPHSATLAINNTGRAEPVGRMTRDDARMIAAELAKVIPTTVLVEDVRTGLRNLRVADRRPLGFE